MRSRRRRIYAPPSPKIDTSSVREKLEDLISEGRTAEALEMVITLITEMHQQNTELRTRLLLALKRSFGQSSERMHPDQLSLLLGMVDAADKPASLAGESQDAAAEPPPASSEAAATGPDAHGDAPAEPETTARARPAPAMGTKIPRETQQIPLPQEQQVCSGCQQAMPQIGVETQEVFEYRPQGFYVHINQASKHACPRCKSGVVTATQPARVIERCKAGPGLLAQILVARFRDYLPYYRQSLIYARQGARLPDSTIGEWAHKAIETLEPLAARLELHTLGAPCAASDAPATLDPDRIIGLDASGIDVLDRDDPRGIHRGTMWALTGQIPGFGPMAVFRYRADGSQDGPKQILGNRALRVMTDAGSNMNHLDADGSNSVRLGCNAHARRKFVEAADAGDPRAAVAVGLYQRLYDIERRTRAANMTEAQILELRQREAVPIWNELADWVRRLRLREPPRSPLGKAVRYVEKRVVSLMAYVGDGRAPIDNLGTEREIRALALGRRNWLFAGSHQAAEHTATILTVLGSARLAGVECWQYLADVLGKLADGWPAKRIDELLPAPWKAEQERQQRERGARDARGGPPIHTG